MTPPEPDWLRTLADDPDAILHEPTSRPGTRPNGGAAPRPGLRALAYRDLVAIPPAPPPMLADALQLPREGLVVLAGPPKVGKTVLAQQIGVVVGSDGQELLGAHVAHGPVLYVVEEGLLDGARYRLGRQVAALGVSDPSLSLVHRQRVRLDQPGSVRQLRDLVALLRPALVVLDPLNRLHGKDENRPTEMTQVMDVLSGVAHDHRCCVVAIHHLSKPSAERRGSVWDRFRGASAIRSGTDANLAMDDAGSDSVRLVGEYRDAEPLDLALAMDRATLTFHRADAPRPKGKVDPDALVALVADVRTVTVAQVATRFGVTPHTARAALEDHAGIAYTEGPRRQRTYQLRSAPLSLGNGQ